MFYLFNSNNAHSNSASLENEGSLHHRAQGRADVGAMIPALITVALVALVTLVHRPGYALTDDADKPIQIRSDELVYEEKASRATYKGDVQVNQGSLKITADKVTIEFEDDKVVRLVADGSPAYYSQQLKVDQQNMQADASTIIYHTRDERVDLKGNAHLTQEGNDFRGELIEYDIRAGRVDAASTKPERIKMILQPKRKDAPKPSANDPEG